MLLNPFEPSSKSQGRKGDRKHEQSTNTSCKRPFRSFLRLALHEYVPPIFGEFLTRPSPKEVVRGLTGGWELGAGIRS
jgi:hypothetical protein